MAHVILSSARSWPPILDSIDVEDCMALAVSPQGCHRSTISRLQNSRTALRLPYFARLPDWYPGAACAAFHEVLAAAVAVVVAYPSAPLGIAQPVAGVIHSVGGA